MNELPKGIIVPGVLGLAKVVTRRDRADRATIDARRAICRECEHGSGRRLCGLCKCIIAAKVRLAGQSCPLDPPKWASVPTPT